MNTTKPRTGLGRGLGELLQRTDPDLAPAGLAGDTPSGAHFAEIPVNSIRPNPKQPRTVFDEDALNELAESIKEIGLLQPVVVRPLDAENYELVMGERRFWRLSAGELGHRCRMPQSREPLSRGERNRRFGRRH